MSLISGVYEEGTGRRVHGGDNLCVDDVFQSQFVDVVPMSVILFLSQKGNSRLSVIGVSHRHVQIINEENFRSLSLRSVLSSGLLFQLLFQVRLQSSSVSEVVEVDLLRRVLFGFSSHNVFQNTFCQLRFSGPSISNQQRRVFNVDEFRDEVGSGQSLDGGDSDVTHLLSLRRVEVDLL